MNAMRVATWRDVALILLAAQAIVLGLLSAAGLYYGLRGVQRLRQWIRPILFEARVSVWKVQQQAVRVIRAVAAPFVWMQSVGAGLHRVLEMLGWR
jgi:hypothetical protein